MSPALLQHLYHLWMAPLLSEPAATPLHSFQIQAWVLRPTHKPSLMSQALRKPFLSSPQTPAASLGLGTFSRTHPGSCMSSRRHPVRNGTSASNIQGSPRQGLLIHERLLLLPGTSFHILNHLENSRLAFTCQLRHCFSCEVPADVSR